MKTKPTITFIFLALLSWGCYQSSTHGRDGRTDPATDRPPDGADARPDQPDAIPDTWPDTTPDVWPDVPPDVLPDYPPDTWPDVPPDAPWCYYDWDCMGFNEFCQFAPGACAAPGKCTARGSGDCPSIYAPVCGCDGTTYGNDCERVSKGASLWYVGECKPSACFPGDPMDVCSASQFCEGPPGMCDLDGPTGWCAPIPGSCPEYYSPVCGCDGATYDNDCFRQAAGVWPDHDGLCETTVACYAGDPYRACARGEFCEGDEGMCDVMGATGWCQAPDTSCGWLYDPVCGCNNRTYPNDCERQAAGVWRRHWGECRGGGTMCSPTTTCAAGAFCEYPPGDCGMTTGSRGRCQAIPSVCPDYYAPVCGCDSITYDNNCYRQASQVALCYRGSCGPGGCAIDLDGR